MKENHIRLLINYIHVCRLIIITVGVGLIVFSNLQNTNNGILLITSFLGVGIFIVIPTKIYLTFQALKKNDEKLNVINRISL